MSNPTKADLQRLLDEMQAEYKAAPDKIREVMRQPREDWMSTPIRTGWGGELFLAETLYTERGEGLKVRLTQDGISCFGTTWSTADHTAGEDVYFEDWDIDMERRVFHGYVDSVTRYLVQSG